MTLVALIVIVPSTKAAEEVGLDPVGAVLSALAIAALVIGIIEGPDRGWSDPLTVGALVAGVVLLATVVGWELRSRAPMLDPRLFRHRGLATGSAAMFLQFLAMFGFFFVSVQYLQLVLGYGALKAAGGLFPMSMVFVVISPFAATLSQRYGLRVVGGAGLTIAAGGFAILLTVESGSGYWLFLASSLVLGLGMALAMTPATNAIVASLPRAKQGVASAVNDLSRELGAAFGVAIIGSAFNTGYRSSIDQHLGGLDSASAALAHESPATALNAASRLGQGGEQLVAHANAAFISGLRAALVVSGAAMLLGAAYVVLRAPKREEEIFEDALDAPAVPDAPDFDDQLQQLGV